MREIVCHIKILSTTRKVYCDSAVFEQSLKTISHY